MIYPFPQLRCIALYYHRFTGGHRTHNLSLMMLAALFLFVLANKHAGFAHVAHCLYKPI